MKKLKLNKKTIEAFSEHKKEYDEKWMNGDYTAFVWKHDSRTLLWFLHWKNDWQHWDTLIHEVSHLVHDVFKEKEMADEDEAIAYQTEFLFREIRRNDWRMSDNKGKR
jgi:hypothetical protein